MSAAQIARDQIKDLQQQILEKDVALKGMQAKNQTLNDQAATLHLVAHQLGVLGGEDVIKAVPEAVRLLIEQLNSIAHLPERNKPEPAADYDTLRRQFASLWTHVNALQQQVKFYRDKDYAAARETALAGAAEINGLRDANQQLTDQLLAAEAEREHITEHAVHAARCQLINEIVGRWNSDDQVTVEQVIDLLIADKETADAE
jgi:hypothetical protein